jgi:hypothetical protein
MIFYSRLRGGSKYFFTATDEGDGTLTESADADYGNFEIGRGRQDQAPLRWTLCRRAAAYRRAAARFFAADFTALMISG